jgi:hypothetical protein
MRSHIDIEKGNAKHAAKASKFYKALAQRLVNNGHAMDCFACALDQVQLSPTQCVHAVARAHACGSVQPLQRIPLRRQPSRSW